MNIYEELKLRGLVKQVTDEEKIRKLVNDGKAVFYIGFDPTADSLHVGHFVQLCFMKRLQMKGNKPIVLLGGGTGYVGDPSDRTQMRSLLSPEIIEENCRLFKNQIAKFIDFSDDKAICVNNADWLLKLKYVDLLREVGAHFTVNNMLRADAYKKRWEKGLTFLEFNYMIMQSYDFYHLFKTFGCNLQFGGDDQWSNMLAGTELIRRKLRKDAEVMTIPLLLNKEGNKMGKTASGAIWLDEKRTSPFDFYQYWRNVADADVIKCLKMLTFLPIEEIEEMAKWQGEDLNKAKEILAFELTTLVHGKEKAQKAKNASSGLFGDKGDDSNAPVKTLEKSCLENGKVNILDLLCASGLCLSKSEGRRLLAQGGLSVEGEIVKDIDFCVDATKLQKGVLFKKGKKTFLKVEI